MHSDSIIAMRGIEAREKTVKTALQESDKERVFVVRRASTRRAGPDTGAQRAQRGAKTGEQCGPFPRGRRDSVMFATIHAP